MIIAVSMRVVENSTYPEKRDAISHDWVRFLDFIAITPVFIPNVFSDPASYFRRINAKGLIITGGNDIGHALYLKNSEKKLRERDYTEMTILQAAINSKMPVLGVCRGLQILNIFFGGELDTDLSRSGDHVNINHSLDIVMSPFRKKKCVKNIITNSYHNHGVFANSLSDELKAFALAKSDLVEGFKHDVLPVLAVQWHPERTNPAFEFDGDLLKEWLSWCE